jgi:hypothetical protein
MTQLFNNWTHNGLIHSISDIETSLEAKRRVTRLARQRWIVLISSSQLRCIFPTALSFIYALFQEETTLASSHCTCYYTMLVPGEHTRFETMPVRELSRSWLDGRSGVKDHLCLNIRERVGWKAL